MKEAENARQVINNFISKAFKYIICRHFLYFWARSVTDRIIQKQKIRYSSNHLFPNQASARNLVNRIYEAIIPGFPADIGFPVDTGAADVSHQAEQAMGADQRRR